MNIYLLLTQGEQSVQSDVKLLPILNVWPEMEELIV